MSIKDLADKVVALTDESTPTIKTFTKRGRGKKQCPKCRVIVGVRNAECICGHTFVAKSKTVEKIIDSEVYDAINLVAGLGNYPGKGYAILYVPAGNPLVKFRGNVISWAESTIRSYFDEQYVVSPFCLRYLLRRLGGTTEDIETLTEWIEKTSVDIAGEILGETTEIK